MFLRGSSFSHAALVEILSRLSQCPGGWCPGSAHGPLNYNAARLVLRVSKTDISFLSPSSSRPLAAHWFSDSRTTVQTRLSVRLQLPHWLNGPVYSVRNSWPAVQLQTTLRCSASDTYILFSSAVPLRTGHTLAAWSCRDLFKLRRCTVCLEQSSFSK